MSTTRQPGARPSRSARPAWRMAARRRNSRISRAASGRHGSPCNMAHLLVRHKVDDFDRWKAVFDGHAAAQRTAGITVTHVMRNVEDVERAKAFVFSPQVPGSQEESGVLDRPDIYFLE